MTTDVTLAITNGSGYDLYDVYNHCKYRGGTLNLTRLGWWRRAEGLIITLTQPLVERRANMHGMTLKISGVVRLIECMVLQKKGEMFNYILSYALLLDTI